MGAGRRERGPAARGDRAGGANRAPRSAPGGAGRGSRARARPGRSTASQRIARAGRGAGGGRRAPRGARRPRRADAVGRATARPRPSPPPPARQGDARPRCDPRAGPLPATNSPQKEKTHPTWRARRARASRGAARPGRTPPAPRRSGARWCPRCARPGEGGASARAARTRQSPNAPLPIRPHLRRGRLPRVGVRGGLQRLLQFALEALGRGVGGGHFKEGERGGGRRKRRRLGRAGEADGSSLKLRPPCGGGRGVEEAGEAGRAGKREADSRRAPGAGARRGRGAGRATVPGRSAGGARAAREWGDGARHRRQHSPRRGASLFHARALAARPTPAPRARLAARAAPMAAATAATLAALSRDGPAIGKYLRLRALQE